MARSPNRKLKVFQAQFGFYDTVVAAPSQAAALRAWDTHQNLFASGDAKVAVDDRAIEAAMSHPETPLRRAIGSNDPFEIEPAKPPRLPGASTKGTREKAKSFVIANPPPPADRSELDAAEAYLREIDGRRTSEEACLEEEAKALELRRSAAQKAYDSARGKAVAVLEKARKAYVAAGGKD